MTSASISSSTLCSSTHSACTEIAPGGGGHAQRGAASDADESDGDEDDDEEDEEDKEVTLGLKLWSAVLARWINHTLGVGSPLTVQRLDRDLKSGHVVHALLEVSPLRSSVPAAARVHIATLPSVPARPHSFPLIPTRSFSSPFLSSSLTPPLRLLSPRTRSRRPP